MGRHSAPETDEESAEPEPAAVAAAPTAPVPPIAAAPAAPVSPVAPSAPSAPAGAASGTRGDLQLLRADTGLTLRCAGAVVLMFLIYTSVLFLMARTDVYLIWLWIPTVLSGMTIGGLLDRAHRRTPYQDRSAS